MSLLWPRPLYIGALPGAGWSHGKGKIRLVMNMSTSPSPHERSLETIEALLNDEPASRRFARRAIVTVSDSSAAVLALPWQALLRRQEEQNTYAKLHYERNGLQIDDGWVVHTEFPYYGSTGLAYAVRRDWLQKLLEILDKHGLRLGRVLPSSAAVLFGTRRLTPRGRCLVLLEEGSVVTALALEDGKLLSHDAEPVIGAERQAMFRLLARVKAYAGKIDTVVWYCDEECEQVTLNHPTSTHFPDAVVTTLPFSALKA